MKPRKPIKRSPLKRGTKRIKASNAYTRPEWRTLVAAVKKRSKGVCEARIACAGDPATGDPHHLSYVEGVVGPKRLLVPLDQLVAVCRRCHLQFHVEGS